MVDQLSDRLSREKALVLFSGGQDSTTCLAWALQRFARVDLVGFDYGQRHRVELAARQGVIASLRRGFRDWSAKLGEDDVVDLGFLGAISETALTQDVAIALRADGLPNTFVPGRNLLFLTVAATLAYRRGAKHVVIGACETDFSGYPDCRDDAIKAMQVALNLGMAREFVIHAPLMWLNKAQVWALADSLGGAELVALVREETHSCYNGDRHHRHDWGYGCGVCPACKLRADGYHEFLAASGEAPR